MLQTTQKQVIKKIEEISDLNNLTSQTLLRTAILEYCRVLENAETKLLKKEQNTYKSTTSSAKAKLQEIYKKHESDRSKALETYSTATLTAKTNFKNAQQKYNLSLSNILQKYKAELEKIDTELMTAQKEYSKSLSSVLRQYHERIVKVDAEFESSQKMQYDNLKLYQETYYNDTSSINDNCTSIVNRFYSETEVKKVVGNINSISSVNETVYDGI